MICKYLKTSNWQVQILYHKWEMIEINNSVVIKLVTAELYLLIIANLEGVQNWFLNIHFKISQTNPNKKKTD